MMISMIVAASENNVIGLKGEMPWRLSGDLKLLKSITMGHALLMGRKTFESIGKPLPGRENIVLTKLKRESQFKNLHFCSDEKEVSELLAKLEKSEVFIFGGTSVYEKFLPKVNTLYFTRVHAELEGDTFLPLINWKEWELVKEENFFKDQKNQYDWSFQTFTRKVT